MALIQLILELPELLRRIEEWWVKRQRVHDAGAKEEDSAH
jgi:hypothetical protein